MGWLIDPHPEGVGAVIDRPTPQAGGGGVMDPLQWCGDGARMSGLGMEPACGF